MVAVTADNEVDMAQPSAPCSSRRLQENKKTKEDWMKHHRTGYRITMITSMDNFVAKLWAHFQYEPVIKHCEPIINHGELIETYELYIVAPWLTY